MTDKLDAGFILFVYLLTNILKVNKLEIFQTFRFLVNLVVLQGEPKKRNAQEFHSSKTNICKQFANKHSLFRIMTDFVPHRFRLDIFSSHFVRTSDV